MVGVQEGNPDKQRSGGMACWAGLLEAAEVPPHQANQHGPAGQTGRGGASHPQSAHSLQEPPGKNPHGMGGV